MLKSEDMQHVIYRISEEIFRPHRKHGYDPVMNELIEKCGREPINEHEDEIHGNNVIEALEEKFYKILSDSNIEVF